MEMTLSIRAGGLAERITHLAFLLSAGERRMNRIMLMIRMVMMTMKLRKRMRKRMRMRTRARTLWAAST